MSEKITKDDNSAHVIGKLASRALFSDRPTAIGVLLIAYGITAWIALSILNLHFDRFEEFSISVASLESSIVSYERLTKAGMAQQREAQAEVQKITSTNRAYLDRNRDMLKATTDAIKENVYKAERRHEQQLAALIERMNLLMQEVRSLRRNTPNDK